MKPNIEGAKKTLERRNFPVNVVIEPIAYCNLRCSMCPSSVLKRERGEMEFSVFTKIVDEMVVEDPTSHLWLAFIGEPMLLGNKLVNMIRYAKERGHQHVHLNTNACLLTPEMGNKLIDAGLDEIIVSIDGFSKEVYEKIRIGGDYEQVVKNVEWLLQTKQRSQLIKPHVVVQFIVMTENEHEVEDFKEYWLSKGAVVKIRPKMGWGTAFNPEYFTLTNQERDFPCPWLLRSFGVHWNGKLAQCDSDYETLYSPGDIRTQTIREVWDGELAKRRERHWNGDFSMEPCKSCKDWQAGLSEFYYPNNKVGK